MKKFLIALTLSSFLAYQVTETREDVHGKTHLTTVAPFTSGSAMRESVFNHASKSQHANNQKKGSFQVSVFGGKNTKRAAAAAYFMPYGHKTLTFQDTQEEDFTKLQTAFEAYYSPATAADNLFTALPGIDVTTAGDNDIKVTRFTLSYDNNTDTSMVRPWNFGITYASTQDIYGGVNYGDGIYSCPEFKSSISPEFHRSNAGAAAAFKYHFSEDPKSFWFEAATSVEWVRTQVKLNEKVETEKTPLTVANFAVQDLTLPYADVTTNTVDYQETGDVVVGDTKMKGEVALVWISTAQEDSGSNALPTGTYWPVEEAVTNGGDVSIANVEHAFKGGADVLAAESNKIWNYGKVDGARKTTRLADIELKMGYNFVCTPTYNSNGYLGVVIPTGNKVNGEFLGEAIVGNGKHFGIMAGGTTEIELSSDSDWDVSYRIDTNGRYLFKNTQKRSFDLVGNEWSRYLMVWNKEDWKAAFTLYNSEMQDSKYSEVRNYSAGINFFTKDMYVTPGFQGRINQSLLLQSEKYSVEFGWNLFAREAEKVALTSAWSENIAFPEATISPFIAHEAVSANTDNSNSQLLRHNGLRLAKNNKTYNNDALYTTQASDTTWNSSFEITEAMLNLESAASPQTVTHTPYVSVNYVLGDNDSDRPGFVGVGASYEFAQNNNSLNQWQLWGKLGFSF